MMIILAQGAAWVRTERLRDRLGRVEATDIERLRTDIQRIQANAPFPSALSGRLRRAVTERMLLIADRPIHDYRQDLFVSQLQWQEAQRSLALAAEFDAGDQRLAAKTALVDGHLTRISAQDRGLVGARPAEAAHRRDEPLHRIGAARYRPLRILTSARRVSTPTNCTTSTPWRRT